MANDAVAAKVEQRRTAAGRRRIGRLVASYASNIATLTFASWNQINDWLRRLEALRQAA
jgi:hypothetical protein